MHGNTNHLHLHLGFAELKPNHINRDGKILYRRLGMITEEEKNYFKNELLIAIERNSVMKPMLVETNKDIDDDEVYKLISVEVKKANKQMPTYKYVKKFEIQKQELLKTTTHKIKRY